MSMVWLAVDEDCTECVFTVEPTRSSCKTWRIDGFGNGIELPEGSIKKLIGKELTWNDEPVELE